MAFNCNNKSFIAVIILFLLCLPSCKVIKPYQRVYLNDAEMHMGNSSAVQLEKKVQDIREGASPPGGTYKTGGCGCN
jgi:hypothetical protein